ncbi:hypothetical protein RFF05_11715 [Bengtsoniella intestinalis]|uniref:hypothetical protein n=1 Tax=Bengtsoniella intestinalis TaxID=3073143 RepID=UPI00391F3C78
MELSLTEKQFRYLLDLVYIGNWVMNSTRGDDRIEEYDRLESHVFSQCAPMNMGQLTQTLDGEILPSKAFARGGIHEVIEQYEDVLFYEILAEEMALRDMDAQGITPENYHQLLSRIDRYLAEFHTHGTDHVHIDMD